MEEVQGSNQREVREDWKEEQEQTECQEASLDVYSTKGWGSTIQDSGWEGTSLMSNQQSMDPPQTIQMQRDSGQEPIEGIQGSQGAVHTISK